MTSRLEIPLSQGVSYYATVLAFNRNGMYSAATADGIVIDRELPLSGAVLDGDQRHDLQYQSNTSVLSAQWHGFFDRHSFIEYYNYTITIPQPHSSDWNIDGPGNVGLKLFVSVNGLSLRSGVRYHANVRATDATGLHSEIVVSDGVTVDSSPPVFVLCQQFGENLLTDKTMQNTTSMNEIVNGWNVDVGKVIFNTSDIGQRLLLSGTISRKIAFISDVIYQLDIRARAVGNAHTQHMVVTAPGIHRVIALEPNKELSERYRKNNVLKCNLINAKLCFCSYKFQIVSDVPQQGLITLSSVSSVSNIIAIESVIVQMCIKQTFHKSPNDAEAVPRSITLNRDLLGPYDLVEAAWRAVDAESGIKEYLWAIGTVRGGQQLQTFQSIGLGNHVINRNVSPRHGINVFITIVAINNAGLSSTLHAEPLLVDFTPPEISEIVVERSISKFDLNVEYLSSRIVTASWNGTRDTESGIDYCQWAIGNIMIKYIIIIIIN